MTVEIRVHQGDRRDLLPLLRLAEDSQPALDSYLDQGMALVAVDGDTVVGQLLLTPTADAGTAEVKNVAVAEDRRGAGIGRALVEAALRRARGDGQGRVTVATGAADVGNLRFYQRLGFRMLSVERDAFVPGTGYPEGIEIDGIPLRDRVWFDIPL